MEDKEGWVYILTNEAMPGLVKIGYTMQDPSIRAGELSNHTGVPIPYDVNYKALVVDPYQVEQKVHRTLDSKRLNEKREFFKCEPFEVIRFIREMATVKYEVSKQEEERKLAKQKQEEERKQKKIFENRRREEKHQKELARKQFELRQKERKKEELRIPDLIKEFEREKNIEKKNSLRNELKVISKRRSDEYRDFIKMTIPGINDEFSSKIELSLLMEDEKKKKKKIFLSLGSLLIILFSFLFYVAIEFMKPPPPPIEIEESF